MLNVFNGFSGKDLLMSDQAFLHFARPASYMKTPNRTPRPRDQYQRPRASRERARWQIQCTLLLSFTSLANDWNSLGSDSASKMLGRSSGPNASISSSISSLDRYSSRLFRLSSLVSVIITSFFCLPHSSPRGLALKSLSGFWTRLLATVPAAT